MTVDDAIKRYSFIAAALCFTDVMSFAWSDDQCPCANVSLCQPIQVGPRHEKFAFIGNLNNWRFYDYSQVTTMGMFLDELLPEFYCYAHSKRVRLVWTTGYDLTQLDNITARTEWIQSQVDKVKNTFTDGINIDVEGKIREGSEAVDQYTILVQQVTDRLHSEVPGSQVSVDTAWSVPCKDHRCYDYAGLANASDFLFIMGYDIRSQIWESDDCIAWANAGIDDLRGGLVNYTELLHISPWKLVLGLPWYGYDYRCFLLDANLTCHIREKHAGPAPCSDSVGNEFDYSILRALLRGNSTTGRIYDNSSDSAFFNYIHNDHGHLHQVWMDDQETLLLKYDLANNFNLRGVGMWHADALDYSANASSIVQQDTREMWDAMHRFPNKNNIM